MSTRTLKLILAFTLLAFAGYVYVNPPKEETSQVENPPKENPTPKGESVCWEYVEEDISTLDADLVHQMTENYRDNQLKFINTHQNSKTTNDAYSIWFDFETLKKFIYHVEKISTRAKPGLTTDDLGIRIYYASYPEKIEMEKYPDLIPTLKNPNMKDYGALHTLVMIPTISKGDGNILDFNPLDIDTYSNGLAPLDKYKKDYPGSIPINTAALSSTASNTNRSTNSRNHGTLIPPDPNTIGLGF